MAKLEASVLAFERKLANSDGLMYAGHWDDRANHHRWESISSIEKAVRGTISNRLKTATANDPSKLDAEIQKANLQRVDNAALPFDKNTLKVSFTLRVLGSLSTPSVCNNPAYQAALAEKIDRYVTEHGFTVLANRYAENIANGRFLWRNRVGAEAVEIHVHTGEQSWIFDGQSLSLREFSQNNKQIEALASVIAQGLRGEKPVFLRIDAFSKLGQGQEVFPSQELILDKGKSDKSKVLYSVQNISALHSQKIGNALRTIDTWYPDAEQWGPIAAEPYGAVTTRGTAYRQPKEKMDFYSLLDTWMLKDQAPELEQQHYVMAILIRGGVFGKAD